MSSADVAAPIHGVPTTGRWIFWLTGNSVPLYIKHGFYWCICNHGSFTKTLISYYMINYYIKYVELIDTVFLVLKKKPLGE